MRQWLTIPEWVELNLKGLPGTTRGLAKFATRENWVLNSTLSRKREGSIGGGGYEYHLKQLPMVARLDYLARQVVIDVKDIAAGRPEIAGEAKPVFCHRNDRTRCKTGNCRNRQSLQTR